jgi:hypothetical protein
MRAATISLHIFHSLPTCALTSDLKTSVYYSSRGTKDLPSVFHFVLQRRAFAVSTILLHLHIKLTSNKYTTICYLDFQNGVSTMPLERNSLSFHQSKASPFHHFHPPPTQNQGIKPTHRPRQTFSHASRRTT